MVELTGAYQVPFSGGTTKQTANIRPGFLKIGGRGIERKHCFDKGAWTP